MGLALAGGDRFSATGAEMMALGARKVMSAEAGKSAGSPRPQGTLPELKILRPEETAPAAAVPAPELPGEGFLAELAEQSLAMEAWHPKEILKWAVERFAPKFTMATAFGPEGMTIIHMLAEVAPETPIFNLDTGYQFAETLELREEVKRRYGIAVELKKPELTVEEYEKLNGGPVYRTESMLQGTQVRCAASCSCRFRCMG